MTNPPTTPSGPDGERERASVTFDQALEFTGEAFRNKAIRFTKAEFAEVQSALASFLARQTALRSPPSPGDEIPRLREALRQAAHNLRAASKLYDCPGCKAGAVLAEATLSDVKA